MDPERLLQGGIRSAPEQGTEQCQARGHPLCVGGVHYGVRQPDACGAGLGMEKTRDGQLCPA
jgi:hypothetical protein